MEQNKRPDTGHKKIDESLQRGLTLLKRTIQELMGSLKTIQDPLSESRKSLPLATSQLDRITAQTEAAANKVLDVIENISRYQTDLISVLNKAINSLHESRERDEEVVAIIEEAEELANRSQNDTFLIMDALQFQDITTQQLNHAASLLDSIETKIDSVIGDLALDESGDKAPAKGLARKKRIFDPHADMVRKQTDQSGVDDLVRSATKPDPS